MVRAIANSRQNSDIQERLADAYDTANAFFGLNLMPKDKYETARRVARGSYSNVMLMHVPADAERRFKECSLSNRAFSFIGGLCHSHRAWTKRSDESCYIYMHICSIALLVVRCVVSGLLCARCVLYVILLLLLVLLYICIYSFESLMGNNAVRFQEGDVSDNVVFENVHMVE